MFTVNGTIEETNWKHVRHNDWHCSMPAATPAAGRCFHIPMKGWNDIGWSFSCFVTEASCYLLTGLKWLGSISISAWRRGKRAARQMRRATLRTAAPPTPGGKRVWCFRL